MYLLDTNIISELRKSSKGKADENVMQWFKQISLEDWLMNYLLPKFSKRILPMDTEVALTCAEFHIPDHRPINDSYIAATAKVNHLTLVTRNVKDFAGCGIKLINPFETE